MSESVDGRVPIGAAVSGRRTTGPHPDTPFPEFSEHPGASGFPQFSGPPETAQLLSEGPPTPTPDTALVEPEVGSPFPSAYGLGDEMVDPAGDEFRALLGELYDEELDSTLWALVDEADAHVRRLFPASAEGPGTDLVRAERLLRTWSEPLHESLDDLLERMAAALAAEDPGGLNERRIVEVLEAVEPGGEQLSPVFEDFLKSIRNKAATLANRAARQARRGVAAAGRLVPVAALLRKIAPLVRPLLQRVLRYALDRLPLALRPYATRLAQRYLKTAGEVTDGAQAPVAVPDVTALQLRFDATLAELLFAADEYEQETLLAAEAVAADSEQDDTLALLDTARQRFVQGLEHLEEGQDPTRLVEEFLPVAALRLGIRLAGRRRVVRFLSDYLGRLIAPYVGPRITPALSRAIVDAGLRMATLEAPEPEAEQRWWEREPGPVWESDAYAPGLAAEALATLVEDTAVRVAGLDEELFEDPLLLESAVVDAVREAAAASFPHQVLRADGLAPQAALPAVPWVGMPRGAPRRYRKCLRVFDVTITPQAARAIGIHGGRTLDAHLRERCRTAGPVRARIHLYQAVPGTRLGRIASSEAEALGGNAAAGPSWEWLHPLTPAAAGLLLGDPSLSHGQDGHPDASFGRLSGPGPLAVPPGPPRVGQRFYAVQLPGAPAPLLEERSRRPVRPAAGPPVTAVVDGRRREIRVAVHLPEAWAQTMAAALRRGDSPVVALAELRRTVGTALRRALSGPGHAWLRVEQRAAAAELPGGFRREVTVPGRADAAALARRLATWVGVGLSRTLARERCALVGATTAEADGITLLVHLVQPPGFDLIHRTVARPDATAEVGGDELAAELTGAPHEIRVEIIPGYRRA
ncbi:predicted protein [Streptomyces viridochromogenes DSM 40736]|uniref:Predicted protein n=1 Tax=Streptomyces viridochromogenes (strain DSM 40736 / JCM 4977 / BCRC 1201 / Tue 494) TaxID=591159 RepID=D9XBM0_STRVT|nr:hypothetical protein [Streptomyces viridochromogenes]EFL36572.1 predicted protein [Streptomyces viridochromogenes DSM 40736]